MIEKSRELKSRHPAPQCFTKLPLSAAPLTVLATTGGSVSSCSDRAQAAADGGASRDAAAANDSDAPTPPDDSPAGDSDEQWDGAAPDGLTADSSSIQPLGEACAAELDCARGHCVDGVCCATASCPICQACGNSGACQPAPSGTACLTAQASASVCDGQGACVENECEPGYLDCDGNPSNGCETAFSLPNCGACGVRCSPENVVAAVCSSAGECSYTACSPGYLDCDGNKANGCETPFSLSNCGGCGTICQPANVGAGVCSPSSGGCTYTACAPFDGTGNLYLDCDGNKANGCESNPAADQTCGSCGISCGANAFCGQSVRGVYGCRRD